MRSDWRLSQAMIACCAARRTARHTSLRASLFARAAFDRKQEPTNGRTKLAAICRSDRHDPTAPRLPPRRAIAEFMFRVEARSILLFSRAGACYLPPREPDRRNN